MYLRALRYRSISVRNQQRIWQAPRAATVSFSTSQIGHIQGQGEQQLERDEQHPNESKNNGHQSRKYAPIRPITLFAICIPLGYALNWLLKQQDASENGVTSDGFVKYTLSNKEDISSTCSIFTLKPATSSPIDIDDPDFERVITSVQFKQPQLQIARNYTLLPRKDGQGEGELRFLIRRERNGEVSGYLHRLPVGAEMEVRGVFPEYKLPQDVEKVIFLGGGTGIAPAMQGAEMLVGSADVHILWASRRREDCLGGVSDGQQASSGGWSLWSWWQSRPVTAQGQEKGAIVAELDRLKQIAGSQTEATQRAGLYVDYFVDEEGTFIQPNDVQKLLQDLRTSEEKSFGIKILFVSGPDGFINHWAAPKQWKDGREVQGRLGGVLSKLDLAGWEVVKL